MKYFFLYRTLCIVALAVVLVSCAGQRSGSASVACAPSPCVVTPDADGKVAARWLFTIPEDYPRRRARLVITPRVMLADTVQQECMPLIVDADIYHKKQERRRVLTGRTGQLEPDTVLRRVRRGDFTLPYEAVLQLPGDVMGGRVEAVLSTDGCGECTGIDTVLMAEISNPLSLLGNLEECLRSQAIDHEFVVKPKVINGKGEARLQFVINRWDIRPEMGRNRAELDSMCARLAPVLADTLATVDYLTISGMASADGSFPFNTQLAMQRATSARQWLLGSLRVGKDVQRRIKVDSRPEGWEPVLAAMTTDGHPDSLRVKEILVKHAGQNDDVAEWYIRRLACWNTIKERYLQKDRKVEYTYAYTLKSFTTDEQLLRMYTVRPDAFNDEEFLRTAWLQPDASAKQEVYETMLRYYPSHEVGLNNLAVLYIDEGRFEEAVELLTKPVALTPRTANTLAVAYINLKQFDKAAQVLSDQPKTTQSAFNLGLLLAHRHDLKGAYEVLRHHPDVSSAIVALSVDEIEEAHRMMQGLDDRSPRAEYVRALIAARQNRPAQLMEHLRQACADPVYRERARQEVYFKPYRESAEFKAIVL